MSNPQAARELLDSLIFERGVAVECRLWLAGEPVCPVCGYPIAVGAELCARCGEVLDSGQVKR